MTACLTQFPYIPEAPRWEIRPSRFPAVTWASGRRAPTWELTVGSSTGNVGIQNNLGPGSFNNITQSGDSGIFFNDSNGFVISPWTGNWSGLRITSSVIGMFDNIGIGTAAPLGALDVVGPSGANSWYYFRGNAGTGTAKTPSASFTTGFGFAWNPSGGHGENVFAYGIGAGDSPRLDFDSWNGSTLVSVMTLSSGNVGIGTTSPNSALEVKGNITLTVGQGGAITFQDGTAQSTAWTGVLCGGDYAEAVDVFGDLKHYGPGDVLVLGSGDAGEVEKSSEPYSTMVTGVYATKPGIVGRREALAESAQEIPMAMVGIVPTKVSAENGSIRRGDLLVTSSKPGYAMKGTERSRLVGAIIGKAMGSLKSGTGVIEVVVTLQ